MWSSLDCFIEFLLFLVSVFKVERKEIAEMSYDTLLDSTRAINDGHLFLAEWSNVQDITR